MVKFYIMLFQNNAHFMKNAMKDGDPCSSLRRKFEASGSHIFIVENRLENNEKM